MALSALKNGRKRARPASPEIPNLVPNDSTVYSPYGAGADGEEATGEAGDAFYGLDEEESDEELGDDIRGCLGTLSSWIWKRNPPEPKTWLSMAKKRILPSRENFGETERQNWDRSRRSLGPVKKSIFSVETHRMKQQQQRQRHQRQKQYDDLQPPSKRILLEKKPRRGRAEGAEGRARRAREERPPFALSPVDKATKPRSGALKAMRGHTPGNIGSRRGKGAAKRRLEEEPKRESFKDFLAHISMNLQSLKVSDLKRSDQVYSKLIERTLITPEIREQAKVAFERLVEELCQEVVQIAKGRSFMNTEGEQRAEELIFDTDDDDLVIKKFNVEMLGKDIQTLQDGVWLNDEIINFHMKMMKDRMDRNAKSDLVPEAFKSRNLFFNTFFYAKLSDNGKGYNYKAVRRWSKKQKVQVHESQLDKVITPINVGNSHWCLSVINFKEKRIEYYDSLGGTNPKCMQNLRRYVQDEAKQYRKEEIDMKGWTDYTPRDIPQQRNGCDCGVFTTKYADYISENRDLDFTQDDMRMFRRRMALEIAKGHIL